MQDNKEYAFIQSAPLIGNPAYNDLLCAIISAATAAVPSTKEVTTMTKQEGAEDFYPVPVGSNGEQANYDVHIAKFVLSSLAKVNCTPRTKELHSAVEQLYIITTVC